MVGPGDGRRKGRQPLCERSEPRRWRGGSRCGVQRLGDELEQCLAGPLDFLALRAAGKPPKVALTAVMRKLLILANALVRQDRTWTESPPRGCSRPAFPELPATATVHG